MQRPLLLALLLLMALIGAGWFWWQQERAPEVAPSATTIDDSNTTAARADQRAVEPALVHTPAADRALAPVNTTAERGSGTSALRILARWPDESAATDVMLTVRGRSRMQGWRVLGQQRTDGDGRATFVDIPKGKWSLQSDRGDRETIDVTGGEQDIVFDLRGGVTVIGKVLSPTRTPVAGASIWLQTRRTDWSGGRVVTITSEDGTFALSNIPAHLSLGATARDFTPSSLLDLDTVDTESPPVAVTLTLNENGGNLVGRVFDVDDEPVAGAIVTIGKMPRSIDTRGDRVIEKWSTRTERTDEHGNYSFDGVAAGLLPVSIQAEGYGISRDKITIRPGETTRHDVHMLACATVYGVITDGNGKPVANAVLQSYDKMPGIDFIAGGQIDFDEPFRQRVATADDNGAFVIHNVTPGTAYLFAQPGGRLKWGEPVPHHYEELAIDPGERVEWNPVLTEGRTIEGVIYFKDGHPMPSVFVTLVDEKNDREHIQTNNDQGAFRFVCLDDSTYTVRVQYWDAPKGTPPLQRSGLVPNQGRVELHAPFDKPVKLANGHVSGRVDDIAGRIVNAKEAHVILTSDKQWFRENGKIVDGAFRFADVEPCRFRLILVEGDNVITQTDWFTLDPGATLDTGVIRTEPAGKVSISLQRPAGTESAEPKLYLRRHDGWRSTTIAMGRDSERLVDNITPGTYTVSGYAGGVVALRGEVTIVAGSTASLNFTLQPGVSCRFEAWFPPRERAVAYTYVIARDLGGGNAGEVFHTRKGQLGQAPTRPFPFGTTIPKGNWIVDFTADDKFVGRATIVVRGDEKTVKARLDLTPK